MRYFGLDIATTSGWVFLEEDRLIEKGTIQLLSQMDLPQKLYYFRLELKNILERLKPEWIFVEDVFLGISGARTLSYLSRLNGVAIVTAFETLQERVKLYEPPKWKANSFENLNGHSKKWEIQIAVIKHYSLPVTGNFDEINKVLIERDLKLNEISKKLDEKRLLILKEKSNLNRKRNPLDWAQKQLTLENLKENSKSIILLKKELKDLEKSYDKKFSKISIDLAAQTGITDNIADSCGIAYCGYKETILNANKN